jgi:hypothetical protein
MRNKYALNLIREDTLHDARADAHGTADLENAHAFGLLAPECEPRQRA